MAIAKDITARADELAVRRQEWEREWRDIADYALPSASRSMALLGAGGRRAMLDQVVEGPSSREQARRRYDSTALWAVDRLSAGVESLVIPQAEKWHTLGVEDMFAEEPDDATKTWLEKVRDYQFKARYDAKAGFSSSSQRAFRSTIAFGTGYMFVEEGFGAPGRTAQEIPVMYSHIPLAEGYIADNHQGIVDTFYRRCSMTARQMVQRFGEKCSQKVKSAADDPGKMDTRFPVIHAVFPRQEYGSARAPARKAAWASFYVEEDGQHELGESGFHEFPYIVFRWLPSDDSPYGESPVMLVLDDIRGLSVMKKSAYKAMQQLVNPPLAVAHDGVMNRPNLNPGAINMGAMDEQRRLKIAPILTGQNPSVIDNMLEMERNTIKEGLLINLFQTLIQNPNMTATEAMLRANEKGELLGPSGAKLQEGLSFMVERELGILERKGAFEPGASLEAPQSLYGKNFGVRFTSPLDRLRRMAEAIGVDRTVEFAMVVAQAKPEILDAFDFDYALQHRREVTGAPNPLLLSKDRLEAIREQRNQQAAMAQQIEATRAAGEAAGEVATAGQTAADMAGAIQQQGGALSPELLASVMQGAQ
jgi:hypothetical protein